MTRPACAGSPLDFHSEDRAVQEACEAICRRCPIAADCFAGAVERDEPCGVWGAVVFGVLEMATADELVAELLPAMAVHDRARYAGGCRCDDCRKSNAKFVSEWRTRRRYSDPTPATEPTSVQLDLFTGVTA